MSGPAPFLRGEMTRITLWRLSNTCWIGCASSLQAELLKRYKLAGFLHKQSTWGTECIIWRSPFFLHTLQEVMEYLKTSCKSPCSFKEEIVKLFLKVTLNWLVSKPSCLLPEAVRSVRSSSNSFSLSSTALQSWIPWTFILGCNSRGPHKLRGRSFRRSYQTRR